MKGGYYMTKTTEIKNDNIFKALKLIETLYLKGDVKSYMYDNILQEYSNIVDTTQFSHVV